MPQVVVAVIAAVAAEGAVGFLIGQGILQAGLGATIAKALIGGVITMGASAALGGKQKSPESTPFTQEARDRLTVIRSPVAARRVIYGETKVSGPLVFAASTGATKEFLHLVIPVAGHRVKSAGDVYFNENLSTLARYSGFERINKRLGGINQAADADLVAEVSDWTANHRLRGVAYLYPRLKFSNDVFPTGIPNIGVVVKGRYLYDPRVAGVAIATSSAAAPAVFTTSAAHGLVADDEVFVRDHAGSTPAVAKSYTVKTAPTGTTFTLSDNRGQDVNLSVGGSGGTVHKCEWSNNPALAIFDYLLGVHGLAVDLADIDETLVIAAANVCDEDVTLETSRAFTADAATDTLTLATTFNGLVAGNQVKLTTTGTLPAGLAAGTIYWWIRASASAGKLATTRDLARAGTAIDLTSAGSGTHTLTRVFESAFTADPATDELTLADDAFALGTGDKVRLTNSGGGLPAPLVAATDYVWLATGLGRGKLATSLANARAGVAINVTDAGTGTHTLARKSQLRYTIDGSFDLDKKPIDVLEEMTTALAGAVAYAQGKYRLFAGAAVTPAGALDESYLRAEIKVRPRIERRELYNAVRGTYVDPFQDYQPTDFSPALNATYESQDGGQRIARDIELPWTQDSIRAQRIAKIHLEESRQAVVVEAPCNWKPLDRAVWDVVPVTIARLGWSAKNFRILGFAIAENGGLDLKLREYAASVYDWNGDEATAVDPAPDTDLPSAFEVANPTGLVLASGTAELLLKNDGTVEPRIKATWTAPASEFVKSGGFIEVEFKKSADSIWQRAAEVRGDVVQTHLIGVEDGVAYDVRVRARNALGIHVVPETWLTVANHTVIGKTAAPSNVASLTAQQVGNVATFSWPAISDADRGGYELRYMAVPFVWDSARLVSRETKGTLITNTALPPGTWVVGIKAIDTSGNYSSAATTTSITVTTDNTAVASLTEHPRWTGHPVGLVRHDTSGTLIPRSTLLAADLTDAQLWDTFVHSPLASPYYESGEIDIGFDADGVRVYGAIAVTLGPGEAGTPSGEMQVDYRDNAAAYDGFEAWPSAANADFRYLKGRVQLDTSNGVEFLAGFTLSTDKEIRVVQAAGVVIAAGGSAITFSPRFVSVPTIQVTPQGGAALTATVQSPATTGFTAHLFNSAGTDVGGTADWQARGV